MLCGKDFQVTDQATDPPIMGPGLAQFIESGHRLKHMSLKLFLDVALIFTKCSELII